MQEEKIIPSFVREALERAQQSADIMPKSQLDEMLTQELGSDW